jgi:hypothetical protein
MIPPRTPIVKRREAQIGPKMYLDPAVMLKYSPMLLV